MARLTSETAALKIGGLYDLVLVASRRVRELRRGDQPHVKSDNGEIVTAIREIEQGFVGRDYLLKNPEVDPVKKGRRNETNR